MKILAILQNQWFKNPARIEQTIAHYEKHGRTREDFIRDMLFFGCLTGKRLTKAFGEELCDEIIWTECSPKIGGFASSKFPPDPDHIRANLVAHNPDIIISFGKLANDGFFQAFGESLTGAFRERVLNEDFLYFKAPHPAARHATVCSELADVATRVREATAT